ncbi:hypothetical protein C8Q74DRAFT_1251090 [Fomes fomentarius]|nr:hypothetical protein C8Q74DRAFT_1251090 [Fomes fomentarius]
MPHAPSATSTSGYRVPRTPRASPRQAPSLAPALSSTTRSTRRPPWHLRRAPSLMQQSSAISSETVLTDNVIVCRRMYVVLLHVSLHVSITPRLLTLG